MKCFHSPTTQTFLVSTLHTPINHSLIESITTDITMTHTDDIDDMSGRKTPPKEVLQLAQSATVATRAELESFFQTIPTDVYSPLKSQIVEEFTFVGSTSKPSNQNE